jgi:diadenosine tetraphosphate (Ap4A) HIT family hydrolase
LERQRRDSEESIESAAERPGGPASACPFCEVPPERIIAATQSVLALYDGFPVSPGHALVVPRRHVASWKEVSPGEKAAIWQMVDELRGLITDRYRPSAFNVGFNDGAAAGQTVMHFHVHVIPRYAGDAADPRGGIRWVLPDKAVYWGAESDD